MAVLVCLLFVIFIFFLNSFEIEGTSLSSIVSCPFYRNGPNLNVQDLVGSWLTVYTQPKVVNCFSLHIRSVTDLEREQYMTKYGNFSGRVDWNKCLLEIESPLGKHLLQGDGSSSGLLDNIIVTERSKGEYMLQDQSADQWAMFGRRGSEVLVMRDCTGEAAAAFARAPYWPSVSELYAILHRTNIASISQGRVLCEPYENIHRQHFSTGYYFSRKFF